MDRVFRAEHRKQLLTRYRTPILLAGLSGPGLLLLYAAVLIWSLQALAGYLLALVCISLLLWLPGAALLRLLPPGDLAPAERFGLTIGTSCALLPLLLLASLHLGLRWNAAGAWLLLLICALVWLWPYRRDIRQLSLDWRVWRSNTELIGLLLILGLALIIRLLPTRDLLVGMWGDSYHHTVMAWLLAEHGGIFSSWQPVVPLTTFTYHYGFHAAVAWLAWASGLPVTGGVLLVSQVQNALAVVAVHVLTRRLTGSPAAALWAALLVVTLSPLPADYLNWGRSTQLAGQLLLPVVAVAWIILIERATPLDGCAAGWRDLWRPGLLAALLTAGLALTHYRVAVFAACFVLVYAGYALLLRVRSWRAFGRLSGIGLFSGGLALLLILPWLLRLREGALLQIGSHFASQNIGSEQTNALPPIDTLVTAYAGWPLLGLALAGLPALIWRRQWAGLTLPLAALLIYLAANPYLLGLNGAGIITNFAVLIAMYLLLAPLAGYALATLGMLPGRTSGEPKLAQAAQIACGGLLLLLGISWQLERFNPAYMLYTPADDRAAAWIRQETEPDAQIFVNSFSAYSNTLYAGSDGGWWLPFMTGRQTNLPPITYGSEAAEDPEYRYLVNQFNAEIQAAPIDAAVTAERLKAAGYDYLYNGPAANPPAEYLDPARIDASPLYEQVYQHAGATVWRIR